ncbi:transcriptional regulator, GntR family [Kytococcus aerolatus]|uniref:Transcriptional regulator, GntR family n=1 Tax=Kytococcus aerolatus TaxID=592308 RepID=A0A212U5D7_9MICO|nr:GntR family transcriptional regulator [Kytococcus aerolatus]SNC73294.1 transcriptional regulator, GntR family [Kytococcus aerolatus]
MASAPDRPALPPVRRERLHDRLATHIADFIDAQGLSAGDRLPSERQLAAELGVSRATLSRALASLETQGRIEVRHGVGALVRSPEEGGAATALASTLARSTQEESAAAREAILAGLARAAASNPRDALRIAMLAPDGTARDFGETWRCIRHLAGSELLGGLDDLLAESAPAPTDSPALRSTLGELAEAVVRGDASAAATLCDGLLSAGRAPAAPPTASTSPAAGADA